MALTTADKDRKPMVLLKGFDENRFVWFTNYESKKGSDLSENPCAAFLFYWEILNRQVRIEGPVERMPESESENYYHSRPRGSQIGAIVSKQSSVVPGRHVLYDEYEELTKKYSDGSVIPKPKNWQDSDLNQTFSNFGRDSHLVCMTGCSIRCKT